MNSCIIYRLMHPLAEELPKNALWIARFPDAL